MFEAAKADGGEEADARFGIGKEGLEDGSGLRNGGFAEHFGGLSANCRIVVADGDEEAELGILVSFARALAESPNGVESGELVCAGEGKGRELVEAGLALSDEGKLGFEADALIG